MSTPYTMMRCRMKNLISCFKACKVPSEEDGDESNNQTPNPPTIDDVQRGRRDKGVELGTTTAEKAQGGEQSPTSSQSSESGEDGYIVFYFREEDAGVDVIEERGVESSVSSKQQPPAAADRRKKRVTRKIQVDSNSIQPNSDEEHHDTLGESSDSSTSSFAFPTIQREWTGSPVQMPRPEGQMKTRNVCIQCCKF